MTKFVLFISSILLLALFVNCTTEEEPLITHLYGYVRQLSDTTVGVNDIVLQIKDIHVHDLNRMRIREDTTTVQDSLDGYFEMDSVCYGTTQLQGTGYVTIYVDSLKNPDWPTQYWLPTLLGEIDTIVIFITK
jgi:hypothetical protein